MSFTGPVSGLQRMPWTNEIDFTAPDAAQRYRELGITCVRPTPAGYFDSNGAWRIAAPYEPIFEYDPITLRSRGLRCTPQYYNYLNNTDGFNQWVPWFGGIPTIAKGSADPGGGHTAWSFRIGDLPLFGSSGGRGGGLINAALADVPDGLVCTNHIWARCTVERQFTLAFNDGQAITPVAGPEWRRFEYSAPAMGMSVGGRATQLLFFASAGENPNITWHVWHPMMAPGSGPRPYTENGASLVLQPADYHRMPGAMGFLAGYNPEGCFYIESERVDSERNGLYQIGYPGQISAYSMFSDEYGDLGSANFQHYWGGSVTGIEGNLRTDVPGVASRGIQRQAIGWYFDGTHRPGVSFNGGAYVQVREGPNGLVDAQSVLLGTREGHSALNGYLTKVAFSTHFNPGGTTRWDNLPFPNWQVLEEFTS